MKRLLISSLVLSVFFFIKAQEVPKKANLIQIVTLDAIDDAYKNIGRILINEGYELEMADKDFYVITTKVTQKSYGMLAGGSIQLKFNLQFDEKNDTTIINLTGFVNSVQLYQAAGGKNDNFEKNAMRIKNIGAKSSIAGSSWIYMVEIAKKYDNGHIIYIIE